MKNVTVYLSHLTDVQILWPENCDSPVFVSDDHVLDRII
jgi:hypothetical protein